MRLPPIGTALPRLIAAAVVVSVACVVFAVYLGLTARAEATRDAMRQMAIQAVSLSNQIETDLTLFDLALRDAATLGRPREGIAGPARASFPDLPLTAHYIGFINVLNEVGDVVADPRSNVSRPLNFGGRDYFWEHRKNPADILMIGRPFATAPNQHASIPLSRRLTGPDGAFSGVVVAGVRLRWLSDLLGRPTPGPRLSSVTVRRADGVALARAPPDPDMVGHGGRADTPWQNWLQTGLSPVIDAGGIRLFHRLAGQTLVLELTLDAAEIMPGQRAWLAAGLLTVLVPALCVLSMSLCAYRLARRTARIETGANAANDERMHLLATMSHELRTPLTGILGQAELMSDESGLSDNQRTRIARLTEAGTLMRNIINRVTDLAGPYDRAEPPIPTECDLDEICSACLGVFESEVRRKGLRLTSAIDLATPRRVMLAHDQVHQVLYNLLMNAVKFTAQGAVTLRVKGDSERLRFEVTDTGPGIPASKHRRLFRAYDRLDALASVAEGTGLGLSITETLVRQMGGTLGHEENPGGGSLFWVELPTAAPPAVTASISVRAEPSRQSLASRHLRLLLADDLELTRSVTADYLRTAGHTVIEVPDGDAALTAVQRQTFDVVLTDMRMPVMDGLEVTRRIRALPGAPGHIPVVLVTADLMALGRAGSRESGVDTCLMKPFTRAELLTAVASAARPCHEPAGRPENDRVIDVSAQAVLRKSLGNAAHAAHLDAAVRRIEALLVLLATPEAADNQTVRDAVHDLIGVAGMMGLTNLSTALRRFDIGRDPQVPELRGAASDAIPALRRVQTKEDSRTTAR